MNIKRRIEELKKEILRIDTDEKYVTDDDDIYYELQDEKMREIGFICDEIDSLEEELKESK